MSHAIVWADVTSLASGLSAVSSEGRDVILAHVNNALVEDYFGEGHLRLARIMLAAHVGTMTLRRAGTTGTLASESMGGVARSFAAVAPPSGGDYSGTSYGQTYESLLSTSGARLPQVIGCGYRF